MYFWLSFNRQLIAHVNHNFTCCRFGDIQLGKGKILIESFRHKGLRKLFDDDDPKGVSGDQLRKIKQILALLDAAKNIDDLNFPTFKLHPLKGEMKGYWSVWVNANWRIVFTFEDGTANYVDLVDYH